MTNGNNKNGGWNRFLVSIIWGIIIAFAGSCVGGYLILDQKIARAAENRTVNSLKIAKMEECMIAVKEDVKIVKEDVKEIMRILSRMSRRDRDE